MLTDEDLNLSEKANLRHSALSKFEENVHGNLGSDWLSFGVMGRIEVPILDDFDRFFIQTRTESLNYGDVLCPAVERYDSLHRNSSLQLGFSSLFGIFGTRAVNAGRSADAIDSSARNLRGWRLLLGRTGND